MTQDPHSEKTLLAALEVSNSKWVLAFTNGEKIRRKSIKARDRSRFLSEVELAKAKLGFEAGANVLSCYEAGRDGFWIKRWLESEGIECLMVDPASIEINRRKRRAKTDRLDAESLARLLLRYANSEKTVWSVVRIPDAQAEDEMRLQREMDRLKKERTGHINRIKALMSLHGIRLTGSLKNLAAGLRAEILRELNRKSKVDEQIAELEDLKAEAMEHPRSNADHQAVDLMRLRGVGEVSAWVLAKEFFGWREFRNRREVGALAGLTPTPYDSGDSRVEQGISKAGNRRVRRVMIELAWSWVRYQPESELSVWFEKRFAHGSKRMRRVGIVALARKLLVALWKYVEFGEVPAGAIVR
jgi:transposase